MSDIRDWGAFIRGRWDWHKYGYDRGFPGGCQFSDIDAVVEFNGRVLFIETKYYDGVGARDPVKTGQVLLHKALVAAPGTSVLVVYGCGCCDDPQVVRDVATGMVHDWRGDSKADRRKQLKYLIDEVMGL